MDEPLFSEFPQEFTKVLLDHSQAPSPEPAFAASLERRLLERQAFLLHARCSDRLRRSRGWRGISGRIGQRGWLLAAAVLLIAFAAALLAVGPQRVLAQVQRLLGYVPGIGFVDVAGSRVLVSPVQVTREGVTLRVDSVIAGPQRTTVVLSTQGFSEQDLPWPNPAVGDPGFAAFLRLPDGTELQTTRWEIGVGTGKLDFSALPAGTHQVTLVLPRLPLVPVGILPEDWEISLTLRPASGEPDAALFPTLYHPEEAGVTRYGITLRVLDVAQTSTETAIHYQVAWSDPAWEFRFRPGYDRTPELRDDLGHVAWERPASAGSSVAVIAVPAPETSPTTLAVETSSYTGTLVFPLLSLAAHQATLWVDGLEFQVPAAGTLALEIDEHIRIGDSWPLDLSLEVAGFPVHIREARLREDTFETNEGQPQRRTILELSVDPVDERDGFRLSSIDLANPDLGNYGWMTRSRTGENEPFEYQLEIVLDGIPAGKIDFQVTGIRLLAVGPWEVAWQIPGQEPGAAAPVRLFPDPAGQPGGEAQPVVTEVFLSDRLTALRLGAAGLPEGGSLVQALSHAPASIDPQQPGLDLSLEDNWGRRYEPGRNLTALRLDGELIGLDQRWLFFAPLEPLTRSLTLHLPGMEVLLPGQASLEVEVPQEITFHEEEYTVTVIGGGGPERQETQTRQVSDPWLVDMPLAIAGYRLHFTQAQLEHDERSYPPYRLLLTGEPPSPNAGNPPLISLRIGSVDRPDGQRVQIDTALLYSGLAPMAYGGVGPVEFGSDRIQAGILLDATAANGTDLLSGRYRVALDGVTAWIPGPWGLSVPLSGR